MNLDHFKPSPQPLGAYLKSVIWGKNEMSTDEDLLYGIIKGVARYLENPRIEWELRNLVSDYELYLHPSLNLKDKMNLILESALAQQPSPFLRSFLDYQKQNPLDHDIENAMNSRQLDCKQWIIQTLRSLALTPPEKVIILGGWVGVLTGMMSEQLDWPQTTFTTLDVDAIATEKAAVFLKSLIASGRGQAVCQDMYLAHYKEPESLIINTSCEHLPAFADWWNLLPEKQFVLLQSNNYFSEETHVNCVASLEEFKAQTQLSEIIFEGVLPTKKYDRYMIIGKK